MLQPLSHRITASPRGVPCGTVSPSRPLLQPRQRCPGETLTEEAGHPDPRGPEMFIKGVISVSLDFLVFLSIEKP